tara:strand:+ start:2108 stop:3181 length:1074 start_codon:yes stop_codon:yes gene_type:complete
MNTFDGMTNIWVNIKDLSRYPNSNDDFMAIDHLKYKPGYCLISRSMGFNNIPVKHCITMEHNKINAKNLHLFNLGDIVLCRMPNWKTFLPAMIRGIKDAEHYGTEDPWYFDNENDKNVKISETFGMGTFDLYFACCPESDIYLVWHYGNTIKTGRSMLTYKKCVNEKTTNNNVSSDKIVNNIIKNNLNCAPFAFDNSEIATVVDDIIDTVIETNKPKYILHTGIFDRKDTYKNELLRYNVAWLNINNYSSVKISKKFINASHNTTYGTFLSNVSVIYNNQLNDIIKIQCFNNCGLKAVSKRKYNVNGKMIEPQNLKFLNKMPHKICFENPDNVYTYTGKLCLEAKNYLFRCNKIDIK